MKIFVKGDVMVKNTNICGWGSYKSYVSSDKIKGASLIIEGNLILNTLVYNIDVFATDSWYI